MNYSIASVSTIYSCLIPVIIGDKIHSSLLDTGSTVSIIEKDYITAPIEINDTIIMRTAGDGPGLVSAHKVLQEFTINDKTYIHEFLVVDSLHLPGVHVLLGFDIINKLKLTIQGGEPTRVILDQQLVPVIPCNTPVNVNVIRVEQLPVLKLYTCEDITLPANTCVNVCSVLKTRNVYENQPILVSMDHKYVDYGPSEVLTALHAHNEVYFPMYNFSSASIFIPSGTYVAKADFVSLPSHSLVSSIATAPESIAQNNNTFETLVASNTPNTLVSGVLDIVRLYRNQFVVGDEPTGYTDHLPFTINTGNARPIAQRPYRLPVAYEREVNNQLESMERDNIISISKSPWASPMVVVKKKDHSLRLCVDFRRLNSVTEGDSFPLPSIEELLLKVRNSKYFSTLDLKSGYHQVSVAAEDRQKTAFIIGDRLSSPSALRTPRRTSLD